MRSSGYTLFELKPWVTSLLVVVSVTAAASQSNDLALESRLAALFLINEQLNPFEIDVGVSGGQVTLSGVVETEVERELAERITRTLVPRESILNEITVDPGVTPSEPHTAFLQQVRDASIRARIQSRYVWNDLFSGALLDVEVQEGMVRLTGVVLTPDARAEAIAIARESKGVKGVESEIRIDDSTPREQLAAEERSAWELQIRREVRDAWIEAKTHSIIEFMKTFDGVTLDVQSRDGRVKLSGTVETARQKRRLVKVVLGLRGVKRVDVSDVFLAR